MKEQISKERNKNTNKNFACNWLNIVKKKQINKNQTQKHFKKTQALSETKIPNSKPYNKDAHSEKHLLKHEI